jgi:hypothetical protein
MNTGPKRKHLTRNELRRIHDLVTLGVPLKKLLRESNLPISAPSVAMLLKHYARIAIDDTNPELTKAISSADIATVLSLFPSWLDNQGEPVQTAPENWSYDGLFPFGKWVERELTKEEL